MSRLAGRVLLAVFGVAIALALAELTIRAVPQLGSPEGLRPLHEVRPDRPWLYGLRPGARHTLHGVRYEINADGFRDRAYARSKPRGSFRVVVLGDSLAFGYGVSLGDTFSKQLEVELARRLPAEVLNLGVGGYNPYNEAWLFADVGAAYGPDLVLVQFCINDLNDPTLHFDAQTRSRLGPIPAAAFPDPGARLRLPAPRSSLLGRCAALRLCLLLEGALRGAGSSDEAVTRATFAPREDLPPGPVRRWLRVLYGQIAERAASGGAHFAVLAFPHRPQVYGGAADRVQRQLVDLGDEAGWATFDLLPAFRRAAAERSEPLFLDIWHLTPAGHRVAALAIVDEIERRGYLPAAVDP